MADEERKKGPPTHDEVRADERAKVEAELAAKADADKEALKEEMRAEMQQQMATLRQAQAAHMTNVEAAVKTQGAIPALKRTKINVTNDTIRGLAHATGGASHESLPDGTPWTPACPDWVFANYGGTGSDINDPKTYGKPLTDDGRLAEYLFKQAFLNDIKMTQEMLPEAMEAFKERGKTPRLTAPPEEDPGQLAAVAVL